MIKKLKRDVNYVKFDFCLYDNRIHNRIPFI